MLLCRPRGSLDTVGGELAAMEFSRMRELAGGVIVTTRLPLRRANELRCNLAPSAAPSIFDERLSVGNVVEGRGSTGDVGGDDVD